MNRKRVRTGLIALAALISAMFTTAVVAPASASAVTSCTGSYRYDAYLNTGNEEAHLYGWFWSSTGQVCVGQADLYENVTASTGLDERVRVRDGGASGPIIYEHFSGGTINGSSITFTTYVRQVFYYSVVTVCVAVVHQSDRSVVPNTTVCKSL